MADARWTFLSNHGHVLVCLARDPNARLRDIAEAVGVTERTVQGIVQDLVEEGYVDKERAGRRNRYELHPEMPLRHPLEEEHALSALIEAVAHPRDESVGD